MKQQSLLNVNFGELGKVKYFPHLPCSGILYIFTNILQVQLEACRQELSEKLSLLVEAGEALEVLDEKLKNNDKETRTDCKILKTKPKKLEAQGLENKNLSDEESGEECLTSEKLLLEVLEDIEEFDKKEKCFEEKYNKRIKELKESSEKTEYDLKKVKRIRY